MRTHVQILLLIAVNLAASLTYARPRGGDAGFAFSQDAAAPERGFRYLDVSLYAAHDYSGRDAEAFAEIGYGLSDKAYLSVILAGWSDYEETLEDGTYESESGYDGSGLGLTWNFIDAEERPLGLSWYNGFMVSPESFDLESQLSVQAIRGDWDFVYNLGAEFYWEQEADSGVEGSISQSAGMGYQFSEHAVISVEAVHLTELSDGSDAGQALYMGPSLGISAGRSFSLLIGHLLFITGSDEAYEKLTSINCSVTF